MTITFYDYAVAPSPRRARIVLKEKNIAHETQEIDLMTGAQLSKEFRKINPNATVPALKLEDGTVLFENWGIALWAEEIAPKPSLLGKTATEKGLVASWTAKIDFHGTLAFAEAFRNTVPQMKDRALPGVRNFAQVPELAERGFARLQDFLGDLDSQLENSEFVVGDNFSLADIWAITILDACRWIKVAPGEEHQHLQDWQERVSMRASVKL